MEQPIAHRGYFDNDGDAPENSLAAFQRAIDHGYAIELDTQITSDGTVVVLHDKSLLRTSGVDRNVEDMTDAELAEFLKGVETYKEALEAGTLTDRALAEYVTPGNFDYWAALHASATIGTSYYYEAISDARDEDTPAKTDKLYEWLYDTARKEGDTAIIAADETTDGKTENKGSYVVYFTSENEETWKRTARTSMAEERLEEELEAAKTTYGLDVDTESESSTEEDHEGHDHE